jgi:4-hydroxybutyryl-CoA dehydratase/vinylacetyl-CoA-Delta-isomerase
VSYKPPIADLFIGAAQLAAEYHGLENVSHIREKLAQLVHYAEVIRACRKAAAFECSRSESGQAIPNSVYTNAGKYHFASHFHEMVKLVQDIAGGLVITLPTEKDYNNPETRPYIEKYLAGRAGVPTEHKLRIFSLIKDLTATDFGGYNSVVTLHGEGSLAAQMIAITRDYDLNRCKQLAEEAAGISVPASSSPPLAGVVLSPRQARGQDSP